MTTRATLHCLIDELPETTLYQAQYLLELVRDLAAKQRTPIPADDPLWIAAQNAPEDDEPLSAEDRAAIEEASAALDGGDGIPLEMVLLRHHLLD